MDKVLILGIGSFTGRHFQGMIAAAELAERFEFVGVDRQETAAPFRCLVRPGFTYSLIEELLVAERPDYIVNLIGSPLAVNYEELLYVNAGITKDICDALLRLALPVKKLLAIGSAAEYGHPEDLPLTETSSLNPVNDYGLVKVIQSQYCRFYCQVHGLPVTVARTFNILGPGMPANLSIPSFIKQLIRGEKTLRTGNLDTKRDYLDIADVVRAYWHILLRGDGGEIYNVCSGESVAIRTILDFLIARSGSSPQITIDGTLVKAQDIADSFGANLKLADLGWCRERDIYQTLSEMLEISGNL
jgi:GDP-4-dehydro-6-deoxy-D-mannose reductase